MANHNGYSVLEKLVKIAGPSGFEKDAQEYFSNIMKSVGCKTYKDNVGNYYAEIKGNDKLPKLMINAHADTVGFMVKFIDDKGFIFTGDIGPWSVVDYRMLPGTDVAVYGRKIGKKIIGHFGTILPIHELSDDDLKESIERDELPIDIGAKSQGQAKKYVDIGDYAVIQPNCRFSNLSGQVIGTSLDDRVGLYCLYRIAKEIKKSEMKTRCPVTFVSTVTEEASVRAASVAANKIKPDIALIIDTTAATDQIRENNDDTIAKKYGIIWLEKGPALARGPGINDDLFMYLERICERGNKNIVIPYQVEVGNGGNESEDIQISGESGIKTAVVGIPVRNLHTRVEVASLKDIESAIMLCTEFYRKVSRGGFR